MSTDTQTVADEVQKALAEERKRERERTEAQQKKLERYKSEPNSYLRDQARAADRAWELRTERMYRESEKRIAAEEKHAGERAQLDGKMTAIDHAERDRLQQIEENAKAAREEALAAFNEERVPVKRQLAELKQQIEMDALATPQGKRFFGFPRHKGGK